MTPEQQREILKAAAKACGYRMYHFGNEAAYVSDDLSGGNMYWNPLTDSADTSSMCAKLEIDTIWSDRAVICADASYERDQEVRHDCTDAGKEAAWRLAASMAGAKVGGYSE